MLTIKQLLTPRWKVIANFPCSPWKIGDVLYNGAIGYLWIPGQGYFKIENYPAIFKKLEWWEERDTKDLPLFLKFESIIYPVSTYKQPFVDMCGSFDYRANIRKVHLSLTTPSTKEEYEKQNKYE